MKHSVPGIKLAITLDLVRQLVWIDSSIFIPCEMTFRGTNSSMGSLKFTKASACNQSSSAHSSKLLSFHSKRSAFNFRFLPHIIGIRSMSVAFNPQTPLRHTEGCQEGRSGSSGGEFCTDTCFHSWLSSHP